MGPGQTSGITEGLHDYTPDPADLEGILEAKADLYVARATWQNEDGSLGRTQWEEIPRR
jgi:hypothetical protein